jgi:hypothetical protein
VFRSTRLHQTTNDHSGDIQLEAGMGSKEEKRLYYKNKENLIALFSLLF